MDLDNGGGGKRVFNRLGGSQQQHQPQFNSEPQKVCFHWRAGRCTRHPCPYLHSELPHQNNVKRPSHGAQDDRSFQGQGFARRKSNQNNSNHQAAPSKWGRGHGGTGGSGGYSKPITKHQDKICHFWVDGKCSYGEKCRYLHQWFTSDSFTMLTQLPGHEKVISAIAFPMGSDKLYSGSKDKSVRVWDCQTGQCAGVVNLEGEIGCIITEGPWIFVGVPNVVKVLLEEESILIYTSGSDGSLFNTRDMNAALPGKRLSIFGRLLDSPWKRTFISKYGTQELDCFKRQAWNTQTNTELPLSGPVGQVYAMVVGNGMLFAGTQDGSILAWRFSASTNCFEPTASLKGHTLAVVSLVVGANRLYSGSMDNTIRVWDLENLQCIQTLTEHTSVVMAVLCWEQFLLSCSLDRTIKVWAATETGTLEVTYTHTEDQGVLGLCGMHDAQSKPVLMCSCNNNTVHLYDLPSFNERGKIFSKEEVRALEVGPGGLFFTGDGTGELKVWRWSDTPPASA